MSVRVVSSLDAAEFGSRLTNPNEPIFVPKIVFAELTLGTLATNIDSQDIGNLPYSGIAHLRDCLRDLQAKPGKPTKVSERVVRDDLLFRTIQGGFYVGAGRELNHYPMPPLSALESTHHEWWRSAQAAFGS